MPLIEFVSLDLGSALLSAFLQVFFDRLAPHHLPHFVRDGEVRSELKKWRTIMAMIQALLSDAEEKQSMSVAVKLWLDDVQDLVYDAEDMLDEYATESLKRDWASISSILFNSKTMAKILGITKRLEDLCKKRSELGLMERTSTAVWRRPPSTCHLTETVVYGREEDKAKLLKMMELRDEPSDPNFRVILIVGTAGVGKTTLAQLVYHDEALKDFKLRAWVYVSDDFDVFRISKSILESITHSSCDLKDLNEVQLKLKEEIVKKRFLLVLDDVWCKNKDSWELLKSPFMAGERGSIIIVTTRSTDIADIALKPGSCKHYELKLLTEDDCWGIFQEHALQSTELGTHPNFKSEVIKKCGGSPLAARTLGGLLSSKRRNDKWEDVLNNKIWGSQDSNILPMLKLSYYHLPSYLKRCFAYCAILPKNYKFEEKELVLLWMAEGFINLPSTNNKQQEDMGSEYFCDLLSSSIFQQSSGDTSKFVMHNLFNDLAEWVSGETSFRLEDKLGYSQLKRLQRARHSSYNISKFDGKNKFKVFDEVTDRLRTFLPIHLTRDLDDCYISDEVIFNLLPKFKKLRVLSLRKYHITKLPDSIGKLRYLRYLNLADTEIASLPKSIKALFNLQILILRNCYRLKLPNGVETLINLRHLDIHRDIENPKRHRRERPEIPITEMPLGMQELKYLQTLSNFIVGKEGSGSPLKDLKNLMFLSGELHISQLENVADSYALGEAILSDKKNLEVLILEWWIGFDNSRKKDKEKDVIDMLRPHANLKKLTINNYGGSAFPAWIGDPSFSNMVVLRLEGCENCTSLPSLGVLSKLKELTISGMKKLTKIDSGFYGSCSDPFHSLEILRLKHLQEWSLWDPVGDDVHDKVFNRLHELSIVKCLQLSGSIPAHLPSLRKLVILQCAKLEVSISSIPMLCELEIDDCKKMVYTDGAEYSLSPNSIILSLSEFGNWFGQAFQKVEELKIKCPTLVSIPEAQFLSSLRALEITDCRDIKSLQEVMKQSTRLDRLVIEGCNSLTSVAEGQLTSSLKTLKISSCENLRCLFGGEAININGALLEYLDVSQCPALKSLSSTGQLPEALQRLEIEHCSELTTIGQLPETLKRLVIKRLDSLSSAGQLPASLEHLSIDNCPITTLLLTDHLRASLQHLEILSCSELTSLSSTGHLPASLQRLEIVSCLELTSLSSTGHLPASLQHLQIASCSKLTRLSSGQLLPATLKNLNISRCGISFIADGLQNLYSLQELHILNLTSLSITNLQIYDQVMQRLHKLTSLRKLHIDGCEIAVSFPQEGREMMLPTSLTLLTLTNFRKLSRLSPKGFRNLASLEYLSIFECPNLKSFLKEDLPSSLLKLCISKCPKLTKHCQKGKQYWSNISNIPCVEIDGKYIYEPQLFRPHH